MSVFPHLLQMKMKKLLIASAFLVVVLSNKSASDPAKAGPTPGEVPPRAQLPQPSAAPNASVAPLKKFKDMTIREEEAVVAEIKKLDLPAIFQTMIDAKRVENDSRKQLHLIPIRFQDETFTAWSRHATNTTH